MTTKRLLWVLPFLAAILFGATAVAQHDHGDHGHEKGKSEQKAAARTGDAYPFDTCPVSNKKLGSMGDPIVRVYEGREVRYCCGGCIKKFEKDVAASLGTLDAKIVADQAALYPTTNSIVTGKALPAKPVEFVFGNRLVRVGDAKEKDEFAKDANKFLKALDAAVVAAQGKDYVLKQCPVSEENYGGDMGDPVDVVIAGRLVRVCCKDCTDEVEKTPAKFIEMVDAARKKAAEPKAGETKTDKPKDKK